jgi:hypothetical protein
MKKITLLLLALCAISAFGQKKKKNGVIYVDHPAITVVEDMYKAFVAGDAEKAGSFLADEFRSFYGSETDKNAKGQTKEEFMDQVKFVKENYSYFTMDRSSGAYPDALEYTDGNNDDVVWVQTWDHIKAVHNATGVKIDMPVHRLVVVNSENEILTMINYMDRSPFETIGDAYSKRKNGIIYNQHPFINKVRRMVAAMEFGDLDTMYSFFDEKATFQNLDTPKGKSNTLADDRAGHEKMRESFEIASVDERGYPDYLKYEINDSHVVYSWWDVRIVRKSDKKKILVPLMLSHTFNKDGKITSEFAYYSSKLFD